LDRDTVIAIVSATDEIAAVQPMSIDEAQALVTRVDQAVRRVIVGQHDVVAQVLLVLLAGGHGLLQGVPGLAKTLLVKTLARALDLRFSRIQFTPDLMPADVLGTEVIEEDRTTGHRAVRFVPGPIFAQVILADEINRTPPRTQAALLEAMQEAQVTIAGVRHPLELPLFVLATENPIEQEGTYPLPEAQLDRFMFNIVMSYPSAAEERAIVAATTVTGDPDVSPVASADDLLRVRRLVRDVPAADNVIDYATRLVRATRPGDAGVAPSVTRWVRWGAGPRAGQALVLSAKARAVVHGRPAVSLDDIRAVAPPVLRHRVLVNFQAVAEGIRSERIVEDVLAGVPGRP
jgi:MoxR-like ATPase